MVWLVYGGGGGAGSEGGAAEPPPALQRVGGDLSVSGFVGVRAKVHFRPHTGQ